MTAVWSMVLSGKQGLMHVSIAAAQKDLLNPVGVVLQVRLESAKMSLLQMNGITFFYGH